MTDIDSCQIDLYVVGVLGIEPSVSATRTQRDTDSLHPAQRNYTTLPTPHLLQNTKY